MECDYCGNELQKSKIRSPTGGKFEIVKDSGIQMPFICRRCGGSFCSKHRLPEYHDCPGLYNKVIEVHVPNLEPIDYPRPIDNPVPIDNPEPIDFIVKTHKSNSFFCKIGLHKWGNKFYDGMIQNKNGSFTKTYSKICKNCTKKVTRKNRNIVPILSKAIVLIIAVIVAYLIFSNYPPNIEIIDDAIQEVELLDSNSFFDENKTGHYAETDNYIFAGGDGHEIYLQNNPSAVDPIYNELITFIKLDKTDLIQYSDDFVCADYAELLHNNAEANGIKTAWVSVNFYNNDDGHALNAFNTTDKGLVYIDSTGGTEIGPCSYDRLIGIEIGKPMWYYDLSDCNDDYYYPPFVSSKVESIEIIW